VKRAPVTAHSRRLRALAAAAPAAVVVQLVAAPAALAAFAFGTSPKLPTLPSVAINGKAQKLGATMANFSVTDTRGTKSGWNVTVEGQTGAGKSAVFAQYCPKAKCGTDGEGYVAGGRTLPAGSLKLNSTGAKFSGGTGSTPSLSCSTGCAVDSASAVKIASASTSEFTWTTTGFGSESLLLSVPTTLRALPAEEVYRVNVLWTLSTGP